MKGKLQYLTISMVLLLLIFPFFEKSNIQLIITNIFLTAVLIFGVYAVSYNKKNIVIASALGLPWFVLSWIDMFKLAPSNIIAPISNILLMLFLTFTMLVIFSFVLKSTEVNKDVLYGAVSIYMLIGGIWWVIYMLIEMMRPGSFSGIKGWSDFLYYSFSTLTTVGYGDIVPVTSVARSFAVLEAIVGVMYLAIIISRLVGLYIAQAKR
jgi:voltage-gated potassium channel Kch